MIESLNRDCHCVSLDREALGRALEADPASSGLHALIEERCPHLFASLPLFVSREQVRAMSRVIDAVERVVALPDYREAALAWAPEIACHDPCASGVFVGYDFHLAPQGPQLIEINTNAGGALLNAILARAQRACCEEIESWISGPLPDADIERDDPERVRSLRSLARPFSNFLSLRCGRSWTVNSSGVPFPCSSPAA